MNKADSIQAGRRALEEGLILHLRAPSGDEYTAGPLSQAIQRGPSRFVAYGYGRSRFRRDREGSAWEVADFLVEYVGRGEVTRAVRVAREKQTHHRKTR
jgi:hypothetical protein